MEAKALPACPVETTLTLISDKWKVLIIRDLLSGDKAVWGIKEIHWQCEPKGTDLPASTDGGKRFAYPDGFSRGSAAGRIHVDRVRT